jgi:hypothetical protein
MTLGISSAQPPLCHGKHRAPAASIRPPCSERLDPEGGRDLPGLGDKAGTGAESRQGTAFLLSRPSGSGQDASRGRLDGYNSVQPELYIGVDSSLLTHGEKRHLFD